MRYPQGLVLSELLMVLAIAALIIGFGVPAFGDLVRNQRSWSELHQLHTSLAMARSHAARTNQHVTVCRSADSRSCGSGDSWLEGWIVFEDPDRNRQCTVTGEGVCDQGGAVLRTRRGSSNGGVMLRANHNVRDTVRFQPRGSALGSNGTFTVCSNGEALRALVVSGTGRVRPAEGGDGMC